MTKKFSSEEIINHFGAVRLRVKGSSSLRAAFYSLDEIFYAKMLAFPVVSATNVEPNRLGNMTQQRAKLELRTTEIDETFQISKIIVFIKPTAKSFPEMT